MTNHPNRSKYRYFKVCPRGFDNEITYYMVPLDKVTECEAEHAGYEDKNPNGFANWTNDKVAAAPGVAVRWEDRNW